MKFNEQVKKLLLEYLVDTPIKNIPNKVYHGTFVSSKIILTKGLLPKRNMSCEWLTQPTIYFFTELKYKTAYISEAFGAKSNQSKIFSIFEIKTNKLPINIKFYKDDSVPHAIYTYNPIPRSTIKLVHTFSSERELLLFDPNAQKFLNNITKW
jgi:hypothetical protein